MKIQLAYLLIYLLFSNIAHAAMPPFEAKYFGYKAGLKLASADLKLTYPKPDHAHYASIMKPTGLLIFFRHHRAEENSDWQIIDQNIKPLQYQFNFHGGKKSKQEYVIFDWQQKQIKNTLGKLWHLPLTDSILGFASVRFALLNDLAAGKTKLKYQIANEGELVNYEFKIRAKETLKSNIGEYSTLKVERQRKSRTTTLWLAPKLHFLPIKVEQYKKKKRLFQLRIHSIQFNSSPRQPKTNQAQ